MREMVGDWPASAGWRHRRPENRTLGKPDDQKIGSIPGLYAADPFCTAHLWPAELGSAPVADARQLPSRFEPCSSPAGCFVLHGKPLWPLLNSEPQTLGPANATSAQ